MYLLIFRNAGGQIGKWITTELLKTGKHTALARVNSNKPASKGVTLKEIDYKDKASLVSALKGQDVLVITLGVNAPPDTSEKLFKAAAEAGVPWVIPNEWGGDSNDIDHATAIGFTEHIANRRIIEELGVSSWVCIACGFWYEISFGGGTGRYGFDMEKKSIVFFDKGETKIHTSTFPQVGRAVASLLSLAVYPQDVNDRSPTLDGYRNKFLHISSFKLSQKEMFASLFRITDGKESDWAVSYQPVKERYEEGLEKLKKGDQAAFLQMLYSRGFFSDLCPIDWDRYGLDNEALGLPKENLDEWTKKAWEMAHSGYFSE